MRTTHFAALALALALAACDEEKTCPRGEALCGGACTSLALDAANCGACGSACPGGQWCDAGACTDVCPATTCEREVYVACFATDDLRTATRDLRPGLGRQAGDGPIALAVAGERVYAANSLSHTLSSFAHDLGGGGEIVLGGEDFEGLAARDGLLYVSNAGFGTLIVYDTAQGKVVDEVALGELSGINPRGVAFVGQRAYVALYGIHATSGGQEVVVVDFSGLATCTAPPCGEVVRRISVLAGADGEGLPFPSQPIARGSKVYVTLANLKLGGFGFYTDPAGNGKLAVIDTAAEDAVAYVDLGAECTNPGGVAELGETLWIACGATGNLLPVDLSGETAVPGTPVPTGLVPGKLAFCRGAGYVTDQWSGTIMRFDPAGLEAPQSAAVCPESEAGWAWAADVACAP
jgi:DNA-binding beta-propeller fold protein YncE